ncbi:CHASE3 domain-containing protein [Sphingomonas aestuarii]
MTTLRFDRGLIALVAGFALLLLAVAGTIALFVDLQRAQGDFARTLTAQERLDRVLLKLQDAETGQRGYLLTGDADFLAPYFQAQKLIPEHLQLLDDVVSNQQQQDDVDRLRVLAEARMAAAEETLGLGVGGNRELVIARLNAGKSIMDDARALVTEMRDRQIALVAARADDATWKAWMLGTLLVLCALAATALAWFAVRDVRRRLIAASAARDALEQTNARLSEEAANRETVEGQLRQLQKMESIGQLTGGIAHDFNNMLAIVIGSLDLAKRRIEQGPDKALPCIDNAMEGAERAAQLTSRLLAFSRQQPLAPKAIDVNKLIGGMSEMLRRTLGENVRIETVIAGGIWPAFADTGQLENAVLNLCVNGRDAMPDGGKLTIEAANSHLDDRYAADHNEVEPGQYVMVSVTDSGTGMPPEVIERAFDPFYTTKGVGKGTGLGLSQVFGFVKQSGGHVKIYSEIGVGTTVKLYLPRHFGEAANVEDGKAYAELPRAKPDEIVLVVEDEDRVRHMSVDALRELGYLVVQASDANQALTVLELQPRIDLLFTDVIMPDMNGRLLAEAARAKRPGLKVLYTTGYTKNAIVHNGMLDHDVAFLPKPFTIAELAVKVRAVIDAEVATMGEPSAK